MWELAGGENVFQLLSELIWSEMQFIFRKLCLNQEGYNYLIIQADLTKTFRAKAHRQEHSIMCRQCLRKNIAPL
jgi:hypothetical protein